MLVSKARRIESFVPSWSCQTLVVTKSSTRATFEAAIAERERAFDDRLAAATRHAERAKAKARDADAASDDRVHEFFRLLLSHQGKVRPLRSIKRRPGRPRLRSTVSTTSGILSSIESVAAEVPMSVRTQPGATSKSARGSPAWRAEKHFISMLSAALLER